MHHQRFPFVERVDQSWREPCRSGSPRILSIGQCFRESPIYFTPELGGPEHELLSKFSRLPGRELFVLQDHGDLLEEFLLARLDLEQVLVEVIGDSQDRRRVGAKLQLSAGRNGHPTTSERSLSSARRLEPILVVIEVKRGHGEHPPKDVGDSRRATVVVVDV